MRSRSAAPASLSTAHVDEVTTPTVEISGRDNTGCDCRYCLPWTARDAEGLVVSGESGQRTDPLLPSSKGSLRLGRLHPHARAQRRGRAPGATAGACPRAAI